MRAGDPPLRVYADTSVFGGVFDEEFEDASRAFFDQIRARVAKITLNPRAMEVPIVSARYGADSGIAGGAALCA